MSRDPLKSQTPILLAPNEDGVIAIGGKLDSQTLLKAYTQGIFPWPTPGMPVLWFSPPERAILYLKKFHLSRSDLKALKRAPYEITTNTAFSEVMQNCAETRKDGTWITEEMIQGYYELHKKGHAHSIEAWQNGKLVGGLYGVEVKGVFSAESMFFKKPNASKACLQYLVNHLQKAGAEWIDFQVLNPFTKKIGAEAIPQKSFLKKLTAAHAQNLRLFSGQK